jgi:proton-dependent oligopeptide transporter, POT family
LFRLSPISVTDFPSAMTKLAPARAGGFVMGIWFLAASVGNWLAGKAGSLFESMPLPNLFGWVAGIALAASLVLALLVKPTKRLTASEA